jgi:hypothetical protein
MSPRFLNSLQNGHPATGFPGHAAGLCSVVPVYGKTSACHFCAGYSWEVGGKDLPCFCFFFLIMHNEAYFQKPSNEA